MKKNKGQYTKLHQAWRNMLGRCGNPKHPSYKHYGGRGIRVCKRWHKYNNFAADMGPAPRNLSLDRINNDKGYFKRNCRWATQEQQCWNSRKTKLVTHKGSSISMREWARLENFGKSSLPSRLKYGWSLDDALKMPKYRRTRYANEKFITFQGKRKILADWAEELGINYRTLVQRVRNKWPVKLALSKCKFRGGRYIKPIGLTRNKNDTK